MDENEMIENVTKIDEHIEARRKADARSEKDKNANKDRLSKEGLRKVKRSPARRRAVLEDPGSAIRRLECFVEVDQMAKNGSFTREIIDFIRTNGEMEDLSRDAIRSMVNQYRKYIYSDRRIVDGEVKVRNEDRDDPYYELYSMRRQLKLIEERIEMEVEIERNLAKLFSTTHKEFLTHYKFAEGILSLKDKFGLLKKERGGVKQRVGSGTPGRIDLAEVVANPESRQKVIGLVEALIRDPELLGHVTRGEGSEKKDKKMAEKKNRPKRTKK